MTAQPIAGLHHVTAIASDPQRNLDFYTSILGLRFVKKTVNFDDPGTYHFYFGDDLGSPGTILTFFPWPHARPGIRGAGEVSHTAFTIPADSLDYWRNRLQAKGLAVKEETRELDGAVLSFTDPDGMQIELVGRKEPAAAVPARFADVPREHAIRGFFGVTLVEREIAGTEAALALLGFRKVAQEGNRTRFAAVGNTMGNHVDVLVDPDARHGRLGSGSVHHIAFRSRDYEDQKQWLALISQHLPTSPIMERDYFRSIYFREPGGVLFELATDVPGFAIDEPIESLGESLRIPKWLDQGRLQMTEHLPPVQLHKATEEVRA